ncbi:MAG: lipoyl synthase [Psittacicella sp.]
MSEVKRIKIEKGVKYRDEFKIPVKNLDSLGEALSKPSWLKIKLPKTSENIEHIKNTLREHNLHSVCEEAACPNLSECFNHGTATFMILGAICTRKCPFCDVAFGKPLEPEKEEPLKLAKAVKDMRLKYIVITSVDRDDLKDGGAQHFANCISEIRRLSASTKIETLTPDFKGKVDKALAIFDEVYPDILNHNIETVERLYTSVKPKASYRGSLDFLAQFKQRHPDIPTKSGIMVGLGETNEEVIQTMKDLRAQGVTMLTIGQYLQPSRYHLKVDRYVTPEEFLFFREEAFKMGFETAACGPFVRSSYHADLQSAGITIGELS